MHIFYKRTVRQLAALMFATVALAGCGGGGGGSAPAGAPVPPPVATPAFPVLQTSSSFSLAPIADPAGRTALAGHQLGRVLLPNGTTASAGLKVEWLDASLPASPRVIAAATTDANGAFDIAGASSVAAADQWLRVTLADGAVLRAFASGWTELSFGTEVAVSEIARLRAAGALTARPLPMDELATAQQSLSLLGQARYAGEGTAAAVSSLTALLAQFPPWNQYLDRLSSATPAAGAGDVAAFLPFTEMDQARPATLVDNGVSSDLTVSFHCTLDAIPNWRECGVGAANHNDIAEQLSVRPGGIFLHNIGGPDGIDQLLNQIGDLPVLEFAPVIGTPSSTTTRRLSRPAMPPSTRRSRAVRLPPSKWCSTTKLLSSIPPRSSRSICWCASAAGSARSSVACALPVKAWCAAATPSRPRACRSPSTPGRSRRRPPCRWPASWMPPRSP